MIRHRHTSSLHNSMYWRTKRGQIKDHVFLSKGSVIDNIIITMNKTDLVGLSEKF